MEQLEPERLLETIVTDYSDDVFYCAYLYLNSRELAYDVCQQVFLKVYENIGRFRNESSYRTWVMRIAVNTCISTLRSKEYRKIQSETVLDEKLLVRDDTLCERIEQDQQYELLWEKVNALPPKYREVIILRYFRDYTNREVAEILRIPQATVRTRLSRAQKLLRAGLMEGGDICAAGN